MGECDCEEGEDKKDASNFAVHSFDGLICNICEVQSDEFNQFEIKLWISFHADLPFNTILFPFQFIFRVVENVITIVVCKMVSTLFNSVERLYVLLLFQSGEIINHKEKKYTQCDQHENVLPKRSINLVHSLIRRVIYFNIVLH